MKPLTLDPNVDYLSQVGAPIDVPEWRKSLVGFERETKALGSGLKALGAQALGAEETRDAALADYQRGMDEAHSGFNEPEVGQIEDIKLSETGGAGRLGAYLGNVVPKGIAQLGALAIGGMGAGGIAKATASKAVKEMAKDYAGDLAKKQATTAMKRQAATQLAKRQIAGASGGVIAGGFGMETGQSYGQFANDPEIGPEKAVGPALAYGSVAGMLEFLPIAAGAKAVGLDRMLLRKLIKADPELAEKAVELSLKRKALKVAGKVGVGAVAGAGTEGITEGMQSLAQLAAERYAKEDPEWASIVPRTPEEWSGFWNEAAAGAATGFFAGAAAGPFTGQPQAKAEQPPVQPVEPPVQPVEPVAEPSSVVEPQIQSVVEPAAGGDVVKTTTSPQPEATPEESLVDQVLRVSENGVPPAVFDKLHDAAAEAGVEVTEEMQPQDVVDAIKAARGDVVVHTTSPQEASQETTEAAPNQEGLSWANDEDRWEMLAPFVESGQVTEEDATTLLTQDAAPDFLSTQLEGAPDGLSVQENPEATPEVPGATPSPTQGARQTEAKRAAPVEVPVEVIRKADGTAFKDSKTATSRMNQMWNKGELGIKKGKEVGKQARARVVPEGDGFVIEKLESRDSEVDAEAVPDTDSTGQVVHPTPEGRANFKKWFAGSEVISASNEPLRVYHRGGFDEQDNPIPDIGSEGFHFGTKDAADMRPNGKLVDDTIRGMTVEEEGGRWFWEFDDGLSSFDINEEGFDTKAEAKAAGEQTAQDQAENYEWDEADYPLTEAWIALKNTKRVKDQAGDWTPSIKQAKAEGYDGIVYKNEFEDIGKDSYIAFSANQIKSAVANRGTYEQGNPNILESRTDTPTKATTSFVATTDAALGQGWTQRAIDAGLLVVNEKSPKGSASGSFNPTTNQLTINLDKVPPRQTVVDVLLHEGSHAGLERMLGDQFAGFHSDLHKLADRGDPTAMLAIERATWGSINAINRHREKVGLEAFPHRVKDKTLPEGERKAELDRVRKLIDGLNPRLLPEEDLAYYIQTASSTAPTSAGFWNRLKRALQAWFAGTDFGKALAGIGWRPELAPDLAVALAKAATRQTLARAEAEIRLVGAQSKVLRGLSAGQSAALLESAVWHAGPNPWAPEPQFPRGRPRLDKVGTGEGGQLFGWGWYSAENEEVSGPEGEYKKAFDQEARLRAFADPGYKEWFNQAIVTVRDQGRVQSILGRDLTWEEQNDINLAASVLEQAGKLQEPEFKRFRKQLAELGPKPLAPGASVYRLNIPDESIARMLQWEKPLSEQTDVVRRILERAGILIKPLEMNVKKTWKDKEGDYWVSANVPLRGVSTEVFAATKEEALRKAKEMLNRGLKKKGLALEGKEDPTAALIYDSLGKTLPNVLNEHPKKKVSDYLNSLGIVGNKYLDFGSRGEPKVTLVAKDGEVLSPADIGTYGWDVTTGAQEEGSIQAFIDKQEAKFDKALTDSREATSFTEREQAEGDVETLQGLLATAKDFKRKGYEISEETQTFNYVVWDQEVLDRVGQQHLDSQTGEVLESRIEGETSDTALADQVMNSFPPMKDWSDTKTWLTSPVSTMPEDYNVPGVFNKAFHGMVDRFDYVKGKSLDLYRAFDEWKNRQGALQQEVQRTYLDPMRHLVSQYRPPEADAEPILRARTAAGVDRAAPAPVEIAGHQLAARHILEDEVTEKLALKAAPAFLKELKEELSPHNVGLLNNDIKAMTGDSIAIDELTTSQARQLFEAYLPSKKPNSDIAARWELYNRRSAGYSIAQSGTKAAKEDTAAGFINAHELYTPQVRNREIFKQIGELSDQLAAHQLKLLQEGGLLEQSGVDRLSSTYKHYVPLRREAFDYDRELTEMFEKPVANIGKMMTREGSIDLASAVHVLQNHLASGFTAASAAARNQMMNKFADEIYKDVKGWKPWFYIKDERVHKNDVGFIRDGKPLYIVPAEGNLRAASVVKVIAGKDTQDLSGPLKIMRSVNNWIRWSNVSASPAFMLANTPRDYLTAVYNLQASDAKDYVKEIASVKNYKESFKALKKVMIEGVRESDDPQVQEWIDLVESFEKAGGKTSFVEALRAMDGDSWKSFEAQVGRRQGKLGGVVEFGANQLERIENLNIVLENVMRLSAYKVMRDKYQTDPKFNGMSQLQAEERAAEIARNLTTNFTRRGAHIDAMNTWWLFYNATVQGNWQVVQNLFLNPNKAGQRKLQKAVAGTILFAFMIDQLGRAMSDDEDDDGISDWDSRPGYEKDRKISAPFSLGGVYPAISSPWVFNVFWRLGGMLGEVKDGVMKPQDALLDTMGLVFTSMNPISGGTMAQAVAPSAFDPFMQIIENRNFVGNPLGPDGYPGSSTRPDAYLAWDSTPKGYKHVAEFINDVTGGSPVESGEMDFRPSSYKVLTDFALGSLGRTVVDLGKLGLSPVMDDLKFEGPEKVPGLKVFLTAPNDSTAISHYHDRVAKVLGAKRLTKMYSEGAEKNPEKLAEVRRDRAAALRMLPQVEDTERQIKSLRKAIRSARGNSRTEEMLRDRIVQLQKRFNQSYTRRIGN